MIKKSKHHLNSVNEKYIEAYAYCV